MFNTPILFLIFNRPDTTKQVLAKIRAVKPKNLYIAADGPRPGKEGEDDLCKETKRSVLEGIDWDCEVKTLFRKENKGCGLAVSEAITWFFENVEEGIILEDDCLPSLSFFYYSEYCLNRYRNNFTIMHIGGNNFIDAKRGNNTYFYSAFNHVWGWATWRRAWNFYKYDLKKINMEEIHRTVNYYFPLPLSEQWLSFYKSLLVNEIDTWDYQWTFCIWLNRGLSIYPNVNLVSNIGFGPGATHTIDATNKFSNLPCYEIERISSPDSSERNKKADIRTSDIVFGFKIEKRTDSFLRKSYSKFHSILGSVSRHLKYT